MPLLGSSGPGLRSSVIVLMLLCASLVADTSQSNPLDGPSSLVAQVDTLATAIRSHLSLFHAPPDSAKVARLITQTGATKDTSDALAIGIASLWRRAGEFDLAVSWLDDIRIASASHPHAMLERARSLLTRAAHDGTPSDQQNGEGAFWEACAEADPATATEFWRDLRGLATVEEQTEWAELAGSDRTCPWIRRFVEERAWRSGLGTGERLVLHYGRLDHVRRQYGLRKPRFVQSDADYRGRPPGLEYDDRGLIYLRMGAPEHIEFDLKGATEPGITEHWAYPRPDGYWLYYFIPERGDYSLVERLGPQAKPGHDFFQRYVTNLAVDPRPLKRMVFLDETDPFDAAELRALIRAEQLISREFQRRAITENPDAPEMLLSLDLLLESLRFWNPHSERTSVWWVASVRAGDLETGRTADGAWTYAVEAKGSVLTPDSIASFRIDRRLELVTRLPDAAGLELRHALDLGPGHYPLTFAVLDENRETVAGNWYRDTVVVPDYSSQLPAVSDLAVAPDSGGTWTRDGETFLHVSPSHVTGADSVLHLYFEVYGLPPGAEYEVNIKLVGDDEVENISEIEAQAAGFRLSYQSVMPNRPHPIGTHYTRLDLRETPAGLYTLAVHVKSLTTLVPSLPATTWVQHD